MTLVISRGANSRLRRVITLDEAVDIVRGRRKRDPKGISAYLKAIKQAKHILSLPVVDEDFPINGSPGSSKNWDFVRNKIFSKAPLERAVMLYILPEKSDGFKIIEDKEYETLRGDFYCFGRGVAMNRFGNVDSVLYLKLGKYDPKSPNFSIGAFFEIKNMVYYMSIG